jgi:phage terminase large subunit-like protein
MPDGDARTLIVLAARAKLARLKLLKAQKAEAEDSLLAFVRMFWRVLEPEKPLIEGWLLELLCDTFMAVTDGHLTRVCINVPPGSMKSSLLNVFLPAWEWGPQNLPHKRYLSVSYSTAVPERDNIRFARLINDPVYQALWGDRVKLVRDGSEVVENGRTGWKRVTSTGGSITGLRGDRLLLDDLNNPSNVESEDVRQTATRFVREIMPDRLNDLTESAIINLQQRTHEGDATGVLIEHGQGYVFVCVPMEFDPLRSGPVVLRRHEDGSPDMVWRDPRGLDVDGNELPGLYNNSRGELRVEDGSLMARAEGALCWPERFPPAAVEKLRAEKGQYAWDSQYQQFPGVRGGGIIRKDWWRLWREEAYPELGTVIISVDTAVEEGTQNDYNACTAWGAFAGVNGEPLMLILDAWRARLPLAQLVARIAETCRRRNADYLLIEHKTRGRDVHDEIVRLYQSATWQTILVKAEVSKVSRLKAVEHLFSGDYRKDPNGVESWSGGLVYAPDKDWADMVINEVAAFPYGQFDDLCDTVSQALGWVRKNGVILRKVEFDDEETERARYRRTPSVPYAI